MMAKVAQLLRWQPPWQLILVLSAKPWESPASSCTTSHERQRGQTKKKAHFQNCTFMTTYLFFEEIEYFLRNCKSRWPVFLTGYLEKQLELLTLRPNNRSPKAGLDMRDHEKRTKIPNVRSWATWHKMKTSKEKTLVWIKTDVCVGEEAIRGVIRQGVMCQHVFVEEQNITVCQ